MNMTTDLSQQWLTSGQTVRIAGLDFRPRPHPIMSGSVQSIAKGQATVYFLEQKPHQNIWLLKVFSPARRPADDYLNSVNDCLPGKMAFFTCTQRRLLGQNHVDLQQSGYNHSGLVPFLEGAILMPKVPGTTWSSIADDLCEGAINLSLDHRLKMCLSLAQCISMLEAGECSHRDLSSTNVFFDDQGNAYLIDWDCLYHPSLPFQANTTIGTSGYIAPFLQASTNRSNPLLSWSERADRFAMAVIIAEILLAHPEMPFAHEDGSMLSQKQIDSQDYVSITQKVETLTEISPQLHTYLMQALHSDGYEKCPSPLKWIAALKGTRRKQSTKTASANKSQWIRTRCDDCTSTFKMPLIKYEELRQHNKAIYCRECLGDHIQTWQQKASANATVKPRVSCEHCGQFINIHREKLDKLRDKGNPILCGTCLKQQLARWQSEQSQVIHDYTETRCQNCHQYFHIHRKTLESLTTRGRPVYCRSCFKLVMNSY